MITEDYLMRETPKFLENRHRRNQRGFSLVEVLMAGGILLGSLGAGYQYLGNTIKVVKQRSVMSTSDDLSPLLKSYLTSVVSKQVKSDPCLKTTRLRDEINSIYGPLNEKITIRHFTSRDALTITEFWNQNPNEVWEDAINFCRTLGVNEGCVVFEVTKHRKSFEKIKMIALFKQESFDFKSGKPTDRLTCDNTALLDMNDRKPENTGIGIKANFLVLRAVRSQGDVDVNIASQTNGGDVQRSVEKSAIVRTSNPNGDEYNYSPLSTCDNDRCTRYPMPPDPGKDYDGWAAFSDRGARNASYCKKCERARNYK